MKAQPRGDQIQELREQLEAIAMDDEMAQWNRESLFSEEIREALLPQGFKMPTITPYKGKTDPQEHVYNFNYQMDLLLVPEPTHCRAFAVTLTKIAEKWFRKLEPKSITSWLQFSMAFMR